MFFNLSSPSKFQRFSKTIYPWTLYGSIILLIIGLFFSFFLSPPDYLQGESVRIMYVHVPSAWLSLQIYVLMAICSFISLVYKHSLADIISRACAPIGATFTLITLITGSIWGKPTWGTWWVWDARLTSELILLFIYIGHMLISVSFDDVRKGDRNAAILTLVGIVNLPIIKWSVDWWNTLHQPASLMKFSAPSIDPKMLVPLLIMAVSFFLFFVSIMLVRVSSEILIRKIEILKMNKNKY